MARASRDKRLFFAILTSAIVLAIASQASPADCPRGSRQSPTGCAPIEVPENAELDAAGTGWTCKRGYKLASSKCRMMNVDEMIEMLQAQAWGMSYEEFLVAERDPSGHTTDANGCIHSNDGRAVACPWNTSACAHSRDGSSVSCGGQYFSCTHSRDGSGVSCGGEYFSCTHSRDGSSVSCGGEYSSCTHSRDGSGVSCGGQARWCEISKDGSETSCGGQYYGRGAE